MSYILKTDTKINESTEILYFKGWAGKQSKHPEFSNKLRFAKHWKEKTNCKRFYNRNQETLSRYGFEIDRVIKERTCEQCGGAMDKETRTDAKFCSELCRVKHFQQQAEKGNS